MRKLQKKRRKVVLTANNFMYKLFVVIFGLIFIISSPVFAQSFLFHTSSNVEMVMTDFGALVPVLDGVLYANFSYPISEENSLSYLQPYSEIWIGDAEGNVATGFDLSQSGELSFGEFLVTQDGTLQYVPEPKNRQTIRTQYATIPEMGLPFDLLVDQISYSWNKDEHPDADDFIVMKLVITNTKSIDLDDIFVALSTNWDIDGGDANLDWADWDDERKAGFMYDGDDSDEINPVHTAVVLLNGRSHAHRIFPFTVGGNINSNLYMDSMRSQFMSSDTVDAKERSVEPKNYVNIIVAGPYDIPREKAITVTFAFVAGDNLEDLQKNIEEAHRITHAPDQLTVEPKAGAVKLEWSQPINPSVAGYHVMRRTEQSEYEQVNSSIVNGLVYEDKNLENDVKYFYKIIPVNVLGEEFVINGITLESIEKSATPNPIPLSPELHATISAEKISLTWTKSTDENIAHYILFRNHTGEPPWATIAKIDDLTVTSFVDENVYPEVDYYYTVVVVSTSEVQSDYAQAVPVKLAGEIELPLEEDLESVFVAPNPCDLSEGNNKIVFRNLTKRATIKIYSVSGELIKLINHRNDQLSETWDCKNEQGNQIAAGTYVYYITAWSSGIDGELIASGKFSVLR